MEIRIKKHGKEFESFNSNRPVRIVLENGQEFDLSESCGELVVSCVNECLDIKPLCANQISLLERQPEN